MNTAQSTFIEGMKQDFSPLMTPNNILTDALNATIITYNGNEFILQQDMGNGKIETAFLPKGFVPVGIKEHGGIIYVASYNPLTQMSQVGSFPSPERNISMDENGDGQGITFDINSLFTSTTENPGWATAIRMTYTNIFSMTDIIRPGDSYYIWATSDNDEELDYIDYASTTTQTSNNLINFILGVQNKDGNVINLRASSDEIPDKSWINFDGNPDTEDYDIYNSKISGTLCVTADLPCINGISVTYDTFVDDSEQKLINLNVIPNWDTIRDIQWYQGFRLQIIGNTSLDVFYKWDGTKYTEQDNNYSNMSDSTFKNITDETADFKTVTKIGLGESGTSTIIVTPIMANGLVEFLSQTIKLNLDNIGSGKVEITKWNFTTDLNDGSTTIKLNLDCNPKPNEVIDNIQLDFYSYDDWYINQTITKKYSYSMPKGNSYSGNHILTFYDINLPVKEMYIVVITMDKYVNNIDDTGNTSTLEQHILGVKGLLTTEMFNQKYVQGDIVDFSTEKQIAITLDEWNIVNSTPESNEIVRSFTNASPALIDSSQKNEKFTTDNDITITTLFRKNSNINFNKNYYPFNNINYNAVSYKDANNTLIIDEERYGNVTSINNKPPYYTIDVNPDLQDYIEYVISYREQFNLEPSTDPVENLENYYKPAKVLDNHGFVSVFGHRRTGSGNQVGLLTTAEMNNLTSTVNIKCGTVEKQITNAPSVKNIDKVDLMWTNDDWYKSDKYLSGDRNNVVGFSVVKHAWGTKDHKTANFILWNEPQEYDTSPEIADWISNIPCESLFQLLNNDTDTGLVALRFGNTYYDSSEPDDMVASGFRFGGGVYTNGEFEPGYVYEKMEDDEGGYVLFLYKSLGSTNYILTDMVLNLKGVDSDYLESFNTTIYYRTTGEGEYYTLNLTALSSYQFDVDSDYNITVKIEDLFIKNDIIYSNQRTTNWINDFKVYYNEYYKDYFNLIDFNLENNLTILLLDTSNIDNGTVTHLHFSISISDFDTLINHYNINANSPAQIEDIQDYEILGGSLSSNPKLLFRIAGTTNPVQFIAQGGDNDSGSFSVLSSLINDSGNTIFYDVTARGAKSSSEIPNKKDTGWLGRYQGTVIGIGEGSTGPRGTKMLPCFVNGMGLGFYDFFTKLLGNKFYKLSIPE